MLRHFSKLINIKTVLSNKKYEVTSKVLNRMADVPKNLKGGQAKVRGLPSKEKKILSNPMYFVWAF